MIHGIEFRKLGAVLSLTMTAVTFSACNGGGGGGAAAAGGGANGNDQHQGGGGNNADPCAILNFFGSANANFNPAGIFTVSPVDPANLSSIVPLGNLNPPGHTYPTDHMYFALKNGNAGVNSVKAAAAGTIIDAYKPGGTDWKITVQVDKSFFYYYDHITPANGIKVGTVLAAGDVVGTNSGLAAAVDFGVYNYNNAPLAGILDDCLAESEAYVDSPLKYYAGGLQANLYALAGNTDGKIDYDQAGKLVGDWALAGHKGMESTDYQLAFVYHVGSNSLRIAVGGTLAGGSSSYAVQNGAPDFAAITPANGQVNYQLFQTTNGDSVISNVQFGVLSVLMLSPTKIQVEIFPGAQNAGVFDGNSKVYDR
jgi:hypothetical protein